MATTSRLHDASADANEQIRHLRSQVDQLMRERVTPLVSEAAGKAQDYARQASDMAHHQAEAFSNQVREMPIAAVLVAAAAGYLLGRLAR
jgi:ElaB/YqjD/DUF883 family membrane-anchored ribosome-binding protein